MNTSTKVTKKESSLQRTPSTLSLQPTPSAHLHSPLIHRVPKSDSDNPEGTTGQSIQRALYTPQSLTRHDINHLQRTVGNQAVIQLLRHAQEKQSQSQQKHTPPKVMRAVYEPLHIPKRNSVESPHTENSIQRFQGTSTTTQPHTNAIANKSTTGGDVAHQAPRQTDTVQRDVTGWDVAEVGGKVLGSTLLGPLYSAGKGAYKWNKQRTNPSTDNSAWYGKGYDKYITPNRRDPNNLKHLQDIYGGPRLFNAARTMQSLAIFSTDIMKWSGTVALISGIVGAIPGAQAALAVTTPATAIAAVAASVALLLRMLLQTWTPERVGGGRERWVRR